MRLSCADGEAVRDSSCCKKWGRYWRKLHAWLTWALKGASLSNTRLKSQECQSWHLHLFPALRGGEEPANERPLLERDRKGVPPGREVSGRELPLVRPGRALKNCWLWDKVAGVQPTAELKRYPHVEDKNKGRTEIMAWEHGRRHRTERNGW